MANQEVIEEFIIPTKKAPVFAAWCTAFGNLETGVYKNASVNNCSYDVFGTTFIKAVNDLHQWITENEYVVTENPKCSFIIEIIDGTLDKYGEDAKRTKVYSISAAKAKKLILN